MSGSWIQAATVTAATAGVRSALAAVARLVIRVAAAATATVPSQTAGPWSGRTESVRTMVNGRIPATAAMGRRTPRSR